MVVVPAIDLLDGRVVRLFRGAYDRATVYSGSPAEAARRFADAGAPALHVVDLDGARAGEPVNRAALESIAGSAPGLTIQVGGGIRTLDDARTALEAGATAVIVGSRAVRDPAWLARLVDAVGPGAVIGSLDLRGQRIAVEGWTETAEGDAPEAVWRAWVGSGLARAIVTDTTRDGTMAGVDAATYPPFLNDPVAVAAAGGIAGAPDLGALARAGVDAAIVGRALYDGALDPATLAARDWRWADGVGDSTDLDEGSD